MANNMVKSRRLTFVDMIANIGRWVTHECSNSRQYSGYLSNAVQVIALLKCSTLFSCGEAVRS